jgi:hypothetical protein
MSHRSESRGPPSRKGSPILVKSNFHLIQLRILELKSLSVRSNALGEPLTHVRVHLSMAGSSHISNPIRLASQGSVDIPDEAFNFETDSGTDDPLLSVKVIDDALYVPPSKRVNGHLPPELSSGKVDLEAIVEAGGDRVLSFKMLCDSETGCVPEMRVHVRSHCRKADFALSYLGEDPVFSKAGYVISPQGIQAFPQSYIKRGLPPSFSLQALKVVCAAPAAPEPPSNT